MRKNMILNLVIFIIIFALIICIPSITHATDIKATKEVTGVGDGSMDYVIEGLKLDSSKEYEWALEKTTGATIEKWYDVTAPDYANGKIKVSFVSNNSSNEHLQQVLRQTDIAYFSVREKGATTNILSDYELDLTLPLLKAFNVKCTNQSDGSLYALSISGPYGISAASGRPDIKYQFEKITDADIINRIY